MAIKVEQDLSDSVPLSAKDALAFMQSTPTLIIIDVRMHNDFVLDHLEGALNIPLNELGTSEELKQVPKNKPLLIVCNDGMQSSYAASVLKHSHNYEKVFYLYDGLEALHEPLES